MTALAEAGIGHQAVFGRYAQLYITANCCRSENFRKAGSQRDVYCMNASVQWEAVRFQSLAYMLHKIHFPEKTQQARTAACRIFQLIGQRSSLLDTSVVYY